MRKNKLIVIVGIMCFILISAHFLVRWVEDRIEKEIRSIGFLSYDSLNVDVLEKSLTIFNLRGSNEGYTGTIEMLEIQGLQLIALLKDKEFVINNILAQGVDLKYQVDKSKRKEQLPGDSTKNKIPEFRIKIVRVEDGFLALLDVRDQMIFNTKIRALLKDLSNSDLAMPRTIPAKLQRLQIDSSKFYTANGLYMIDVNKAIYENETLSLDDISIKSKKGKLEIGTHVGHEVDWFNATIDSVKLKIADLSSFLREPKILKMSVFQPALEVFRDKRLPFPKDHHPPLVSNILASKDFTFAFDSIHIENGKIKYEEFVKEEKGPGEITFNELTVDITGLKSYSLDMKVRPRLIASCRIYDQAELFTDISFPKNINEKSTRIKGKLMPIDLRAFNRMIRYVSILEIKSGRSSLLEFDFSYTEKHSSGEMRFAYNDLAISFLEKQESESDGVASGLKSFFVNRFVIDRNNDFKSEKFRMGKIDFERVENKSIFNYWWGSILTGFKSSTGVDTSGEKIDVN